jgi:hypothetical protein
MKVPFTITLPDNPYTVEVNDEITVNAMYEGPHYLVGRWETATGIMHNAIRGGETIASLELDKWIEEGHEFIAIDATQHPLAAAFLTHSYTHEEIPHPTYDHGVHEDGTELGSWTFTYSQNAVLSQIHLQGDLRYDKATDTFTPPRFREHAVDETEFYEGYKTQAALIRESCAKPFRYTDADKATLLAHADWLDKLEDMYKAKGIPHWQIPFPHNLPAIHAD